MSVRVVIAETDPELRAVFRAHVETIPGFEVVGHALDEDRAVGLCDELNPEIVLIGVDEDRSKEAIGTKVKETCPRAKVLVVTGPSSPDIASSAADLVLARPVGTDRFVTSLLELIEAD